MVSLVARLKVMTLTNMIAVIDDVLLLIKNQPQPYFEVLVKLYHSPLAIRMEKSGKKVYKWIIESYQSQRGRKASILTSESEWPISSFYCPKWPS